MAHIGLAIALGLLLALAACGSDERAQQIAQSLTRAQLAIDVTKSSDAQHYARDEVLAAEGKLAESRAASQHGDYTKADRLLAEALVNIDLARAKVDDGRAKARLERTQKSGNASSGNTAEQH